MNASPAGLELLFLGSGNAFAQDRYWSSFLVNERFLFDCSPIAMPHLKKCGIDLSEIEAVFISHFHGDHYFGLPFLLLEYAELTRRTKDLTVVGPPGIEERVVKIGELAYPNLFKKDHGYKLLFREVKDGANATVGTATLLAKQVTHVDDFPCLGYRVETGGRTVAYSGDTKLCDALVDLGTGADVFVLESSCWAGECGPHMTLDDIGELRKRLGPEPRFVLTHLDAGELKHGIENCVLAADFGLLTF